MTYLTHTKCIRTGLIAAAAILAMSAGAATAGDGSDSLRAVFAWDGEITAYEAKRLAYNHLAQLGFTRPGKSHMSARLRSINFVDGNWVVRVSYGGSNGSNQGVLVIDGANGRFEASPLVQYATDKPFEPTQSKVEMAESQVDDN